MVLIIILILAAAFAAGYGFRGLIRKDISKVVAEFKTIEAEAKAEL